MRLLITTVLFALSAVVCWPQPLRFYARPYQVNEGDAVSFIYLETTNTVAKANIAHWDWDFDGNGTIDASGDGADGINAFWYATFDSSMKVRMAFYCRVEGPRLYVEDLKRLRLFGCGWCDGRCLWSARRRH